MYKTSEFSAEETKYEDEKKRVILRGINIVERVDGILNNPKDAPKDNSKKMSCISIMHAVDK